MWIAPIIHPAAILRGGWANEPQQITALTRALEFASGQRPPPVTDIDQPPPETTLWPTVAAVREFDAQIPQWDALSIDIENAGQFITLIGLTCMRLVDRKLGPTLSLPFKVRGGTDYWTKWAEHLEVVSLLYGWLDNPRLTKVFHNGLGHDIPILEEAGFSFRGRVLDTMVMAHYCYPEMRKSLQYCTTLYCWVPCWKLLVEEGEDDEGKT